ncbi:hypothetical protein AAF712_016115 [Marasmius tenuissimus]|uniref:Uncharacterized protein n=1 Tax=Marasmius tenuissimus TaxID=585030 RepID=A0ABR2Z7L1_9AGAR
MRRGILSTSLFSMPLEVFLLLGPVFSPAVALRIEPPLPTSVAALQPVTFTWMRESTDPWEFGFRKLPIGAPPSEELRVQHRGDTGEFTLTFTQALWVYPA